MSESPQAATTLAAAEQAGVPVKIVGSGGKRGSRAPVDIEMTAAAVAALPTISELTLVTGDSDFVSVIEQAHRLDVATTVVSLPETLSPALAAVADHVAHLAIADHEEMPASALDLPPAETATNEHAEEPAEVPVHVQLQAPDSEVTDQELADELSEGYSGRPVEVQADDC